MEKNKSKEKKKSREKKGGGIRSIKPYAELFWASFKLGLFTIGGGLAMVPLMQQIVVDDKKWLTEDEMLDCLAVSQSMPGVIAVNGATYVGKKLHGTKGALAATLGIILPSFIIMIIVVIFLDFVGGNSYIQGAFTGIKAAVCGLILVTAVRLGKQLLKSVFQWILAIAAFVVIGIFGITALWVVLAGAVAGVIYNAVTIDRKEKE